ncbi:MAG TPA: class I SAM-dependent methyltransferase [Candidatus Acidoferrales bacterium]|nr:class I SAM-dependent methyltransferase [Candidatus Acidoferrales bacterium]
MTRLDRLLLRIPRLRRLVLDREAFAAHCARLQSELDANLKREAALRKELQDVEREAAARERAITVERDAAAAHCERLQRELDESAGFQRVARQSSPGQPQSVTETMRSDWDARARAEGTFFIATGREAWTDETFFATGEENVRQHILTDMENICHGIDPKQMRVVEIGCGAGRLTRALAAVFGEVHAVDVSPEMIELARRKLAGTNNVCLYANSGADLAVLPDRPFHFAFSYIVFQHIPDKAIVESYLRDTHRVLVPGSLFKLQVEGGPTEDRTPDTWHGVSFSEAEIRETAERCGFELRHTEGAGTQYFWLWLFRK